MWNKACLPLAKNDILWLFPLRGSIHQRRIKEFFVREYYAYYAKNEHFLPLIPRSLVIAWDGQIARDRWRALGPNLGWLVQTLPHPQARQELGTYTFLKFLRHWNVFIFSLAYFCSISKSKGPKCLILILPGDGVRIEHKSNLRREKFDHR